MIINKNQNKKILIFLLSIFPIALISGPVLPEIYCFFLLFYFIFNFKNILKFHEKKFLIFFFVIYVSINLSSFYSPDIIFSLEKSLPLFRVFFFFFMFSFFFNRTRRIKNILFLCYNNYHNYIIPRFYNSNFIWKKHHWSEIRCNWKS